MYHVFAQNKGAYITPPPHSPDLLGSDDIIIICAIIIGSLHRIMFTKYTKNKCFTTTANLIVHASTSENLKNFERRSFFGGG